MSVVPCEFPLPCRPKKKAADPPVRRPSVLKPERLGTGTNRFRSPSVGPRGPLSRDRRFLPFGCLSVSGRVAPSAPRVRGLSGRTSSRPGDSSGKRRGSQGIVARSKSAGHGARHVPVARAISSSSSVRSRRRRSPHRRMPSPTCTPSSIANGSATWRTTRCRPPTSATRDTTTGCRTSPRPPMAARKAADAKVLDDLARIPRERCRPPSSSTTTCSGTSTRRARPPCRSTREYYSIEASGGPQSLNEIAEVMPFDTVEDYENWLGRMRAIPAYLDQYGERLRRGAAEKRTQPQGRHGARARAARKTGARQARGQPLLRALPLVSRLDPGGGARAPHRRGEDR